MALTGRAALLAALGSLPVGIWEPGWTGILAVNAPLAVACACDFALAAPVRRLGLTRSGDTSVRLGDTADVALTITNPSRRPLRAHLRDAWPPSSWQPGTETTASRHRLTIPAGERRRVTTRLRPTRRGDRQADRVTIRSYGPLGLFSRQGTHRAPWTVRVLPPSPAASTCPQNWPASANWMAAPVCSPAARAPSSTASASTSPATTPAPSTGVPQPASPRSPYAPGAPNATATSSWSSTPAVPRQAAWATHPASMPPWTRPSSSQPSPPAPSDRVDLLAYDRKVRALVQGRTAGDVLPSLVNAMATLEPELVETDARGLTATALRTSPRRSLIVLLTTLDTAPIEDGLLPVLSQLTQRHTVLLASVADPHITEMAKARGNTDAVYEAAAAAQAQSERHRTAEQLRRHGVTVVDATPDDLAPALADAYLALKAAGRL